MEIWLQQLIELLPGGMNYLLAISLIAFAESLPMIGLLVPGSTLIVFSGLLAFHGKEVLSLLIVASTGGALLGDLLSFWLGYRYGSSLLRMRIFQRRHKLVKQAETFFVDHGGKSIFFARFLGPIRGITPFIAGLCGMHGRAFCIYTLISSILWGLCYPALGYLGGSSWQKAQSLSTRFGLLVSCILIVTILHYWIKFKLRPSSRNKGL